VVMVRRIALYAGDPSLNPAKDSNFSVKCIWKRTKIKK